MPPVDIPLVEAVEEETELTLELEDVSELTPVSWWWC